MFLIIDCAGDLHGAPLAALEQGLDHFVAEVRSDALALDTIHVGVITFGGAGARLITGGLVPVNQFALPPLAAGTDERRPLGAALRVLDRAIDQHVRPRTPTTRGDWRPLVFAILAAPPTDDWRQARQQILNRPATGKIDLRNLIAIGCGPDIDRDLLAAIAIRGSALLVDENMGDYFRPYLTWVTQYTEVDLDPVPAHDGDPANDLPVADSVSLPRTNSEKLPFEQVERMLPLLRHVAELVATTARPSDEDLVNLAVAASIDTDAAAAITELRRWTTLLSKARQATTPATRYLITRALTQRGIPPGPARLAIDTATRDPAPPLSVTPTTISLGDLPLGAAATTEVTVHGGPGTATPSSTDVTIEPTTFGPDETVLCIHVPPGRTERMLWQTIALDTDTDHLTIDVTARWTGTATAGTEFVVSPTGPGTHRTIASALAAAPIDAVIRIRPGQYREPLVLNKPLTLVGDGPRQAIIIETCTAPCVTMLIGRAEIHGLTLRRLATDQHGADDFAVRVPYGHLRLDNCDITCASSDPPAAAVSISGFYARATIHNSNLHDSAGGGICVEAGATAIVEDCAIYACSSSGIAITAGSNPIVRNCRIHDGQQSGVYVWNQGRGTIEDCDIYANAYANVVLADGSDTTVRNCRIHNGQRSGVYVNDQGRGTIEDCDIYANTYAGITIDEGSDPTVLNCRIHNGQQSGVDINDQGRGTIEDCDIYANAYAGVYVWNQGRGTIEDCDIYANARANVVLADGSDTTVRNCRIHDGQQSGVRVYNQGRGTIEECSIYGNMLAGVRVENENSVATLRRNLINKNGYEAVGVSSGGGAIVEDNNLAGNRRGAWDIDESSEQNVQSHGNREGP